MGETVQKVQTRHGRGCFELCSPLAPAAAAAASSAPVGRHLRRGAVVLMVGGVLMLCAAGAALCLWKASDKHVYNVGYGMNVGEVREGSVEIDSDNNPERFKTGSGAGEALEIHDFQIGITGIRFFGGDKCYVKSHIKARLPHAEAENKEKLMYDQADDLMPVRYDEGSPVWVAGSRPLTDTSFLSRKILDFCGDLHVYWLRPAKDGERSKRDTERAKRQFSAEEREPGSHVEEGDTSRVTAGEKQEEEEKEEEEEEEEGAQSTAGSAYNPDNPYHRGGAAGEEAAVTFDSMLDHMGICCADCRRSYTHCQRICEPLRGYWPWPYNHRGCRVVCRVIVPCRWWVARILGVV